MNLTFNYFPSISHCARTILSENSCLFVNLLSFASTSFFLSMRKIRWLNSEQPKTRGHVEHPTYICIKLVKKEIRYDLQVSSFFCQYYSWKFVLTSKWIRFEKILIHHIHPLFFLTAKVSTMPSKINVYKSCSKVSLVEQPTIEFVSVAYLRLIVKL